MAENIFASAFSPVEEKETQVSEGNVFSSAFKSTPVGSDVDLENFTYQQFQQSPELREAAVRFAKDHLGYDNPSAEKAISETIEHFREFSVNELVAAGDWNYVSGLKADAEATDDFFSPDAVQKINDYKNLYEAFEALPSFG